MCRYLPFLVYLNVTTHGLWTTYSMLSPFSCTHLPSLHPALEAGAEEFWVVGLDGGPIPSPPTSPRRRLHTNGHPAVLHWSEEIARAISGLLGGWRIAVHPASRSLGSCDPALQSKELFSFSFCSAFLNTLLAVQHNIRCSLLVRGERQCNRTYMWTPGGEKRRLSSPHQLPDRRGVEGRVAFRGHQHKASPRMYEPTSGVWTDGWMGARSNNSSRFLHGALALKPRSYSAPPSQMNHPHSDAADKNAGWCYPRHSYAPQTPRHCSPACKSRQSRIESVLPSGAVRVSCSYAATAIQRYTE